MPQNPIRMKLKVISGEPVNEHLPDSTAVSLKMQALYSPEVPEDASFQKYTPYAHLEAHIDNPAVTARFTPGTEFYADFMECEVVDEEVTPESNSDTRDC